MRIYDNDNDDESWTPQSCNYDAIDDFINILFYLLKKRARRLRFHIVWFLVWEVQKVFFFLPWSYKFTLVVPFVANYLF